MSERNYVEVKQLRAADLLVGDVVRTTGTEGWLRVESVGVGDNAGALIGFASDWKIEYTLFELFDVQAIERQVEHVDPPPVPFVAEPAPGDAFRGGRR